MSGSSSGPLLGERFEVLGTLGEGGMARVLLVDDRVRGERVALKLLHAHLAASPSMRARLQRELKAAAQLRHPNVLVAHDLHELDGQLALSMPVCEGATIAEGVAASGPLQAEDLRRLGVELASALAHAHEQGVLHRDVAPGNVMIDPQGHALLMDFGLARLDSGHTATRTTGLGTAGYAAPELLEGGRGDPQSDLYGLGALLFFAASGRSPFDAPTPVATLKRQLADERPALASLRPDLPPDLVQAIEALLAPDPARRPPGARAAELALAGRALIEPAPEDLPAASVDPALLAPRLKAGPWSVELAETERLDRERRARLRAGLDPHGTGLEGVLRRVVTGLAEGVRTALALPSAAAPEDELRRAVAREAGLPPEALRTPTLALEERFVLVAGVDEALARRLGEAARLLGFAVTLRRRAPEAGFSPERVLPGLAVAAFLGLMIEPWLGLALAALVLVTQWTPARPAEHAPAAFPLELRDALAPSFREALEALEARHAAGGSPSAPPEAAPEALPAARRAAAGLDALAATLDQRAAELPGPVLADLRRSLDQLRARRLALTERYRALEAELALRTGEAEAVRGVEARIERLRALAAMGRAPDPAELARLEDSLARHREGMEDHDRLEAEATRVLAELLDIGSSAARARRELLGGAELPRSAEALGRELAEQVGAARRADDEVDGLDRRAQGRRAQSAAASSPSRNNM